VIVSVSSLFVPRNDLSCVVWDAKHYSLHEVFDESIFAAYYSMKMKHCELSLLQVFLLIQNDKLRN